MRELRSFFGGVGVPGELDSFPLGVDEFKGGPGVVGVGGADMTIPPRVDTFEIGVLGSWGGGRLMGPPFPLLVADIGGV